MRTPPRTKKGSTPIRCERSSDHATPSRRARRGRTWLKGSPTREESRVGGGRDQTAIAIDPTHDRPTETVGAASVA